MRNLTIKRHKSFVGCAAQAQIYIEKSEGGDLVIGGINCAKLGEIKNGEEATFTIENNATKIFVIADKMSRDFCNDCYELGEGEEDVTLSGKCRFNPATGNAFRFDGNDTEAAVKGRKKGFSKGLLVLLGALVIGILVGYFGMQLVLGSIKSKEKTFMVDEMSITLTEGFEQTRKDAYWTIFTSKDILLSVTKDKISESPAILAGFTTEEYAEYIININGIDSQVVSENGLVGFSFTSQGEDGKNYQYFAYVYKSDNSYWLLQFSVAQNKTGKYREKITAYASSVKFN